MLSKSNIAKNFSLTYEAFLNLAPLATIIGTGGIAIAATITQNLSLAVLSSLVPIPLVQLQHRRLESQLKTNSEPNIGKPITSTHLAPKELKALHDLDSRVSELDSRVSELENPQKVKQIQPSPKPKKGRERIAIFVDAANITCSAYDLGCQVDFIRLKDLLVGNHQLVMAYFYTGTDRKDRKQQNFLSVMQQGGFKIIKKEFIYRENGPRKANLDVVLGVNMLGLQEQYD